MQRYSPSAVSIGAQECYAVIGRYSVQIPKKSVSLHHPPK